jgi:hypothetical protein
MELHTVGLDRGKNSFGSSGVNLARGTMALGPDGGTISDFLSRAAVVAHARETAATGGLQCIHADGRVVGSPRC